MTVYLAADHAGFALKEVIKQKLTEKGYHIEDCGAASYNEADDYPDFIRLAAQAVSQDPVSKGIVIGGSGQGEAVVANKFPGVRAAVYYGPHFVQSAADVTGRVSDDSLEIIKLSRQHNDANILSLGARFLSEAEAVEAVQVWLQTPFSQEERHMRRIEKIQQIEEALDE